MIRCSGCKIEKQDDLFSLCQKVNFRHGRYCRHCTMLKGRKDRARNPENANRIARESAQRNGKRLRWEQKLEFIAAYGGKCSCCGEREPAFLTVDHINGNGAEHRRTLGHMATGVKFYSVLKRQGWPREAYRLLCFNCNSAIGIYGRCPHLPLLSTVALK